MDEARMTVRTLAETEARTAIAVINTAAAWYRDFLPPSELHQPEMTLAGWAEEARRMTWYGAFDGADLVGVIGLEYAGDAALLRHAYVRPDRQRQGIAAMLVNHLEQEADGVETIIVGTYAANYKARASFEKAGYQPSPDSETVLRRYYEIPEDRLQSSVTYEKRIRLE